MKSPKVVLKVEYPFKSLIQWKQVDQSLNPLKPEAYSTESITSSKKNGAKGFKMLCIWLQIPHVKMFSVRDPSRREDLSLKMNPDYSNMCYKSF